MRGTGRKELSVARRALEGVRRAMGFGAVSRRDPLGPKGERMAARRLRKSGYRVLARNVMTAAGEADLVCLAPDKRTIVVVEVKARRVGGAASAAGVSGGGGGLAIPPEAAVGHRKQRRLLSVAQLVARSHGWTDRPLRIDVVAIEAPERGRPTIRHHENAVVR